MNECDAQHLGELLNRFGKGGVNVDTVRLISEGIRYGGGGCRSSHHTWLVHSNTQNNLDGNDYNL